MQCIPIVIAAGSGACCGRISKAKRVHEAVAGIACHSVADCPPCATGCEPYVPDPHIAELTRRRDIACRTIRTATITAYAISLDE